MNQDPIMPELPEVESARMLMEKHCIGSSIAQIDMLETGGGPRSGQFDDKVCDLPIDSYLALQDSVLQSVHRRGKQLWFKLSGDTSLLWHFGMTGSFVIRGEPIPEYKSFVVNTSEQEWPPKFTKCHVKFSNGKELAFCDPRRLGKITIRGPEPEVARK